jgi:hypothetical protein
VPKWKREHEELIRNVRAARQATRHLANGGDVRDLPPPPPATEDPSFVPCPHCSRTFAPNAAERHIPKCATAFSRPNPPPRLRSGGGGGGGGADGYARSPGGGGGRGGAGGPIAQVRRPGSRGRGAGGNSRYSVGRRDDHSREGGWDSTGGGGGGWDRDRDSYNGGGGWDSGPSGTSVSFSAYESPQRLRPRQPPSARTPNSAPPKRRPMSSSSSSASASRLNAALRSGYVWGLIFFVWFFGDFSSYIDASENPNPGTAQPRARDAARQQRIVYSGNGEKHGQERHHSGHAVDRVPWGFVIIGYSLFFFFCLLNLSKSNPPVPLIK